MVVSNYHLTQAQRMCNLPTQEYPMAIQQHQAQDLQPAQQHLALRQQQASAHPVGLAHQLRPLRLPGPQYQTQ